MLIQECNKISSRDKVVVKALFEVLKIRDLVTAEHSLNMAYLNMAIAEEFDKENKHSYFLGGLVHDIGKVAMPDSILKSSDRLTDFELLQLPLHVSQGVKLLKSLGLGKIIVDVTEYHHEKMDGSGYPYGLSGEEIPLVGRISSISDTFSTLVQGRSYRKRKTVSESLDIMIKENYLFDDEILKWFIGKMENSDSNFANRDSLRLNAFQG